MKIYLDKLDNIYPLSNIIIYGKSKRKEKQFKSCYF